MFGHKYLPGLISQLKYRVQYNEEYIKQHAPMDTIQKLRGLDIGELLRLVNLTARFLEINYTLLSNCSYHLRHVSKLVETRKQGKKFDEDFSHLTFELKELYENFRIYARGFQYFEDVTRSETPQIRDKPEKWTTMVKLDCEGFKNGVERLSNLMDFVLREHEAVKSFREYLDNLQSLVITVQNDMSKLDEVLKEFKQMKLS